MLAAHRLVIYPKATMPLGWKNGFRILLLSLL